MRRLRTANRKGRAKARLLSWDDQWTRLLWRSGCRDRWALAPAKRLFVVNGPIVPKAPGADSGVRWGQVTATRGDAPTIEETEGIRELLAGHLEAIRERLGTEPAIASEVFGKRTAKG